MENIWGLPFQVNPSTADGRISGTCASLAGLEKALREEDENEVELSVRCILLIHGISNMASCHESIIQPLDFLVFGLCEGQKLPIVKNKLKKDSMLIFRSFPEHEESSRCRIFSIANNLKDKSVMDLLHHLDALYRARTFPNS